MPIKKSAEPTREKYDWSQIEEAGKANPGEWMHDEDVRYPHSAIISLQNGRNRRFPMDEWTFKTSGTVHSVVDGKRSCLLHFKYEPHN